MKTVTLKQNTGKLLKTRDEEKNLKPAGRLRVNLWLPGGRTGRGDREFGMNRCTHCYI